MGTMTVAIPISRAISPAGIEPALGGDAFDRIRHGGGRDLQHAVCGPRRFEAERLRDTLRQRAPGCGAVEAHFAAEKVFGTEPAEHEICIGDCGLASASTVAGGAGRGPRALRTYAQRALLHARNRAAPGP